MEIRDKVYLTIPLTPLEEAHQRGFIFESLPMTSPQGNPSPPGPPASINDQIARLIQRGMLIPDHDRATYFLGNVSFYRLRGYLEPFVDQTAIGNPRPFLPNTSLDSVIERYDFDRQLRTLLLDAFNHIEISIRTQWTYHLAYTGKGGEQSHLNPNLFSQRYYRNLASLYREYEHHGSRIHFYEFANCPIWVITEVMSFGQLSLWYGDTNRQVRRLVAQHYQLDERILQALLRHLAPVRNFCAHHERLWDREFITKLTIPKRMGAFTNPRTFFNQADNAKLYNSLVMIAHLTRVITGNTEWPQSLVALMNQYRNIPQNRMGFVSGWQGLEIWQP